MSRPMNQHSTFSNVFIAIFVLGLAELSHASIPVQVAFSGTSAQVDTTEVSAHGSIQSMYISVDFQRLTSDLSRAGDLLIGIEGPNGNSVQFGGDNGTLGLPSAGDFPGTWNDENPGLYEFGPIDLAAFDVGGAGIYTVSVTNGWTSSNGAEWTGSVSIDGIAPIDTDGRYEHPIHVVGPFGTVQSFELEGQGQVNNFMIDVTYDNMGSGTFASDLLIGISAPNGNAIEFGGHPSFSFGYQNVDSFPGSWDEDSGTYSLGPISTTTYGLSGTGTYLLQFANGWSSSSNASWIGKIRFNGVDERDQDDDLIADHNDNCPNLHNINQEDCNNDGVGDICTIEECNGGPLCSDCNGNGIPDSCGDGFPSTNVDIPSRVAITPTFNGVFIVTTGDMDNDGDRDIIGAAVGAGDVAWFRNDGDLSSQLTKVNIDTSHNGAFGVAVGDIDRDGNLDVASCGNGPLSWWSNVNGDGSTWLERPIGTANQSRSCKIDDMDGDGDLDFILAAESVGFRWYRNIDGGGTAWEAVDVESGGLNGEENIDTGDVDGDGDQDIVAIVEHDDDVNVYLNSLGDGTTWTKIQLAGGFNEVRDAKFFDVDGDGDLDVIGAAGAANDIAWWNNLAGDASSWAKINVDTNFSTPYAIDGVDMDADGDIDILSCSLVGNQVAMWENLDGNGTNWQKQTLGTNLASPLHVTADDMDQDGDIDVLAVGSNANRAFLYQNIGGQYAFNPYIVDTGDWASGELDAPFMFQLTHGGQTGDESIALQGVTIRLEDSPGIPLNNTLANATIESFAIYLDDGSETFSQDSDTLVMAASPSLSSGYQTLSIPAGNPAAQVPAAESRSFFLTMQLKDSIQSDISSFQMTLLSDDTMTVDIANECPLHDADSSSVTSQIDFCFNTGSCSLPPTALPMGPRYIQVTPVDSGTPVALSITSEDAGCVGRYIDFDAAPELAAQGFAVLVDEPVYRLPSEWGVLSVRGEEIIPGYQYAVGAATETQSAPPAESAISMNIHGDIDNNGVANFADIQFVVQGFQGTLAAPIGVVDLAPCLPNTVVNFEDIQQAVLAFQNQTYDAVCELPCSANAIASTPTTLESIDLELRVDRQQMTIGNALEVAVWATSVTDLHTYQLTLAMSDERGRTWEPKHAWVDKTHDNAVFAQFVAATDSRSNTVGASSLTGSITSNDAVYLATFSFEIPMDAHEGLSVKLDSESFTLNATGQQMEMQTTEATKVTIESNIARKRQGKSGRASR